MLPASLSFDGLTATLSDAIAQMDDPRQPSNATSYSLRDAVVGAFSCFFMQSASFLEFQRQLNSRSGQDHAQNSWVANHPLTDSQAFEIAAAGRSRWKTENENHNVLKTQGYNLEHNFGHGKQHLSAFLLTLNLLAFLFHTVLHLADERYQQICQQRGTRKGFFQDILALTK